MITDQLTKAAQDGAKLTQDGHVDLSPYRYCLAAHLYGKITIYHVRTLKRLNNRTAWLETFDIQHAHAERVKP